MLKSPNPKALRFAVVITDGHVTGRPCGDIKEAAELVREKDIHIFSVAASDNIEENALKEIASSPVSLYRDDFKAVNFSQGRVSIHKPTIDRIIKAMVRTHTHTNTHKHTQSLTLQLTR